MDTTQEPQQTWERVSTRQSDIIILARPLSATWLGDTATVYTVDLAGELREGFEDLLDEPAYEGENAPTASLRAMLGRWDSNLITVDSRLGVPKADGRTFAAPRSMARFLASSLDLNDFRSGFATEFRKWFVDRVVPKADQTSPAILRLYQLLTTAGYEQYFVVSASEVLRRDRGRLDFELVSCELVRALEGVTPYQDLSPLRRLITAKPSRDGRRLITAPALINNRWVSLRVKVVVGILPFKQTAYVRFAAEKVNWASRAPTQTSNRPRTAEAVLITAAGVDVPGCISLPLDRHFDPETKVRSYRFSPTAEALLLSAEPRVEPGPLDQHIQTSFNPNMHWVGVPMTTRLYRSMPARTVYEGDEADVLEKCADACFEMLDTEIPVSSLKVRSLRKPGKHAVIKIGDVEDGADAATSEEDSRLRTQMYQEALTRRHGPQPVHLRVYCDSVRERELLDGTVTALFAGSVQISFDNLPVHTHGLTKDLPSAKAIADRFRLRVDAWREAASHLSQRVGPKVALVCAPDTYEGRQTEEPINRMAGIRAFCAAGVDVHHLLPIAGDKQEDLVKFLQRAQSALLDVLFAHTGSVLPVTISDPGAPSYVYGVQKITTAGAAKKGERPKSFLALSRIELATGALHIRFAVPQPAGLVETPWEPFNEGLRRVTDPVFSTGAPRGKQRDLVDALAPQWLSDTLAQINAQSAGSLVMVCWDTLATALPFRDTNLLPGVKPELVGRPLAAAFPKLSIVRVRGNDYTPSVRTRMRVRFQRNRGVDGARNESEVDYDDYYTSTKTILDLTTPSQPKGTGHFVVAMPYGGNAAQPRGLSAFKPVQRFIAIKSEAQRAVGATRQFQPILMPAGSKDVPIPSATDLVVLSTPDNYAPEQVAQLVVGLREGYVHYRSWTRLPVPLFFEKKIRDHLLRLDLDEEETSGGIAPLDESIHMGQEDPIEEGADDLEPAVASLLHPTPALETAPVAPAPLEVVAEPSATLEAPDAAEAAQPQGEDPEWAQICGLIQRLAAIADIKTATWGTGNLALRVKEIIRGRGDVRVPLPAFATREKMFGRESPPSRKLRRLLSAKLHEERAIVPGFEPANWYSWILRNLEVPLSGVILARAMGTLGIPYGFHAGEFAHDMVDERAKSKSIDADFPLLSQDDDRHDEARAWLVLWFGLHPTRSLGNCLRLIAIRSGPLLDQSLDYMRRVVAAVERIRSSPAGTTPSIYLPSDSLDPVPPPSDAMPPPVVQQPQPEGLAPKLENHTALHRAAVYRLNEQAIARLQARIREIATVDTEQLACLQATLSQDVAQLKVGDSAFWRRYETVLNSLAELAAAHRGLEDAKAKEEELAQERERQVQAEHERERQAMLDREREAQAKALQLRAANLERLQAYVQRLNTSIDAGLHELPGYQATVSDADDVRLDEGFNALFDILADAWADMERAREGCEQSSGLARKERAKAESALAHAEEVFQDLVSAGHPLIESVSSAQAPFSPSVTSLIEGSVPPASQILRTPAIAESAPVSPVVQKARVATPNGHAEPAVTIERPTVHSPSADDPRQDEVAEDVAHDSVEAAMAGETFESHLSTLKLLASKRRFGLASSHSTALAVGAPYGEYAEHHELLLRLFDTLDKVVCGPRIDLPADPVWASVLVDLQDREAPRALCANEGLAMAALAATIVPMCFNGHATEQRSQLLQSLHALLQHIPNLGRLIELITQFDQGMAPLTLDECRGLNIGAAVRGQDLKRQMEARAARWTDGREISVSFNHRGSQVVNAYLFSDKAPYGQALKAIASGDHRAVQKLWTDRLEKFKDGAEIDAAQLQVRERRRIEGHFRHQIVGNIAITHAFVREYLALLAPQAAAIKPQGRRTTFIKDLHDAIKQSRQAMTTIQHGTTLDGIYRQSLTQSLSALDRLYTAEEAPRCTPKLDQRLLVCQHLDKDLLPAVRGERPLSDWAETLRETTELAGEDFGDDTEASGAFHRLLLEAMYQHQQANRWYPTSLIASRLLQPQEQGEVRKGRNRRRDELRDEIAKARAQVGQALSLMVIDPDKAAAMEAQLRYIEGRIDVIGTAEAMSTETEIVDFAFASAQIRDDVLRQLELTFSVRADRVRARLALLEETSEGPSMKADIETVRAMLAENLSPSLLMMADDAVGRIGRREPLPTAPSSSDRVHDQQALEEFQSQLGTMCKTNQNRVAVLEASLAQSPTASDPGWRRVMSPERAGRARNGIALWLKVFAANGTGAQQEALRQFLQWLGMPEPMPVHGGAVQPLARWDKSPFIGQRGGFLPPELGSQAKSIAVLADRAPSFDSLPGLVAQIGDNEPTLILTKRRLEWPDRAKLMRHGKKSLLIDETLLLYAICCGESPLRVMLDVTLAFYPASPYRDYGERPAPKEMFFGRLEEIRKLRDIPGAAILYGGRRLGKTSLLNEVESQLEAQKIAGHYAMVLSCNQHRANRNLLTGVWRQIEAALRDRGAITNLAPPESTAAIIADQVEKGLSNGPAKDVYLLIDEVDYIDPNDGHTDGGIRALAHRLSTMIENLDKRGVRLRYCLAGLHDLARMSDEQNSMLGKATTLALEPYISKDNILEGFRLITEPMKALGYEWQRDANLPYRILTTCNYYPAFIQVYCQKLLEHMLNQRENNEKQLAPVTITTRHLDEVEQNSSFLDQIRERFSINLKLDPRYRVIALVLAQRYYDSYSAEATRDGVDAIEIRKECEYWAPRHFRGLGSGAFTSLLQEMQKLTILEYTGSGYRLRNPNIAMMIGNKDSVETDLAGLGQDEPTTRRTHGDRLQRIGSEVFPLPDGLLNEMLVPIDHDSVRPPVPLLVGSKLSGLAQVAGNRDAVIHLFDGWASFSVAKGRKLDTRDSSRLNSDRPLRQIWMVGDGMWECHNEAEATKILRRSDQMLQTRRRLVLEASAQQTWQLARHITGEIPVAPPVASALKIVPVPLWTADTLYYLGDDYIDARQRSLHQRIIDVSGGIGDVARYLSRQDASQAPNFERMAIDEFCTSNGQASFATLMARMGFGKMAVDLAPLEALLDTMHGEAADEESEQTCLEVAAASGKSPRKAHILLAEWLGLVRVDANQRWGVPGFIRALKAGAA